MTIRLDRPAHFTTIAVALLLVLASVPVAAGAGPRTVTCFGQLPTHAGTNADDTIIGTPDDDVIIGGRGDDVIKGKGGNDLICGLAGDDTLIGGGGKDRLNGGQGNDVMRGGPGADLLKGGPGYDKCDGEIERRCEVPRLGVYYYPWYGGDFHGGNYLREHLVPRQWPVLGEYDDRQDAVIGRHLKWSRYAGIDIWVASWWGPGSIEDANLLDNVFTHPSLRGHKIALFYETQGRTDDWAHTDNVASDIAYIADNYFDHPNYLRIGGKPVLFVYLTRVLSWQGKLPATLAKMRTAAASRGYDLYIVGDQAFGDASGAPTSFSTLDAITTYDVYGSTGRTGYATQSGVDSYFADQADWQALADAAGVAFFPAISPGFNDTAARDGHDPLSRKLAAASGFGSLFREMAVQALDLNDWDARGLVMVTSFNEWHEDTQIEPVKRAPATKADDSNGGQDYTSGLAYEGYGLRYLSILRTLFG